MQLFKKCDQVKQIHINPGKKSLKQFNGKNVTPIREKEQLET